MADKHTPYNVSVSASTSAGYGPLTSDIVFTEEGGKSSNTIITYCSCHYFFFVFLVPNISPKNVGVVRLNVTHMNVTWTKLTLEDARGFITAYTVTYEMVGLRRRKEVMEEISEPENSYKVVGGLGFTTSYSVMVSASTIAGQGISSSAITVQGKHCGTETEFAFIIMLSISFSSTLFIFPIEIKRSTQLF